MFLATIIKHLGIIYRKGLIEMANKNRIFLGIVLILLAAAMVLKAFIPVSWNLADICYLVFALVVALYGLVNRSILVTFTGLGLVAGASNRWLDLIPLGDGSLFLVGVFLGLGCHLLFAKRLVYEWSAKQTRYTSNQAVTDFDVIMSSSNHYLHQNDNNVNADVVMGNLNLYVDENASKPITLNLDVIMGNVTVYVPASWQVATQTANIMGTTKIPVEMTDYAAQPDLIIKGDAVMGSIIVKQV